VTTTLVNNAPASSFRAVPPEGRRWPCAAATIRVRDQQVITSPDSERAAESSLGWDETAGLAGECWHLPSLPPIPCSPPDTRGPVAPSVLSNLFPGNPI
jgi:hypothetical protein